MYSSAYASFSPYPYEKYKYPNKCIYPDGLQMYIYVYVFYICFFGKVGKLDLRAFDVHRSDLRAAKII